MSCPIRPVLFATGIHFFVRIQITAKEKAMETKSNGFMNCHKKARKPVCI